MKELQQKIHELVPETMKFSFGCKVKINEINYVGVVIEEDNSFVQILLPPGSTCIRKKEVIQNLGHPIQLHHVLQALRYGKTVEFWRDRKNPENPIVYIGHKQAQLLTLWDLTKPLSEQSPEVIEFLSSVLIK